MMSSTNQQSKTPKNIVIIGGGIQGTSVAYHLAERLEQQQSCTKITILESVRPASAASGKGGGFMARSWGDGSPTQKLHEIGFDLYATIAPAIGCTSYRKIPVLSVSPNQRRGAGELDKAKQQYPFVPSWLDGNSIGRVSVLGYGDDTAQVTPNEYVEKMLAKYSNTINVVIGTCVGVDSTSSSSSSENNNVISGVKYTTDDNNQQQVLPADIVVVSAGPWSCAAEDWFPDSGIKLPMEGIKSTSIVWKQPSSTPSVDGTGLFCGEDHRYGTHCTFYFLIYNFLLLGNNE
jgi:glycine/D-amino acid oxidase-like deaminating enzyme